MDYPEAAGFALAQDRLLAQGGPMKKPKRGMIGETFTKGPLKGKTIDQANMMARQKWSQSSPQLRDGYANSARKGMMSPTEQAEDARRQREATSRSQSTRGPLTRPTTNASLNAALPGETGPQMYARQRNERTAKPPATPQSPLTRPTGAATNDENARAQAMLNEALENDKYATASVGNYTSMEAAIGKQKASTPAGSQPAAPQSPLQRPTIPSAAPAPAALSPMAQAELDKRRAAASAAPTGQPVVSNPGQGINRLTGLPFGYQPGDAVQGDAAMKGRAAQSVSRQSIAESQAASRQMAGKPDPNAGDYAAAGRVMQKDSVSPPREPTKWATGMGETITAGNEERDKSPLTRPLREQHSAAMADYQKDLDPAKFGKINDAYSRGTDLEKAQMVGDSLARKAVPATVNPASKPVMVRPKPSRPVQMARR